MPRTKAKRTRIEILRDIIETPCSDPVCTERGVCGHQGEKDAARDHLARILGNIKNRQAPAADGSATVVEAGLFGSEEYRAAWAKIMANGYDENGGEWWEGHKHRRASHTGPLTYVQAIRADIKIARAAGRAPLLAPDASGLSVQDVELFRFDPIGQAPAEIKISVRQGIDIVVRNIPEAWGWSGERISPQLKELGRELHRVADAYNASYGSNISTGCYAKAFTATVLAQDPHGWHSVI
jgi:hypothetical protein